jgi:hypothetical protein
LPLLLLELLLLLLAVELPLLLVVESPLLVELLLPPPVAVAPPPPNSLPLAVPKVGSPHAGANTASTPARAGMQCNGRNDFMGPLSRVDDRERLRSPNHGPPSTP